jgi:hypothetical protein
MLSMQVAFLDPIKYLAGVQSAFTFASGIGAV